MSEKLTKKVVNMFGKPEVCDEEDEKKTADIVLPADENCENLKEIASKIGKVVVCDENA